ncbi:MAG TPA: RodZ domain-containing protein [Methylophilaceae bacterium]|jgi:cytoskeleton protein RodZ
MSEQDSPSTKELITETRPQLGEVLAAQRELKKMTVSEVASQLRLGVRQINALEANDFTKLPEPMITRGFIRNYARLLGLDAEPLIQAHRALSGADQPHSLNISSANISIANHHVTPWLKIILSGLVVLLIVLGLSYYAKHPFNNTVEPTESITKNSSLTESPSADATSAAVAPVEEKLPEPALPIAERMAENELAATSSQLQAPDASAALKPEAQVTPNETVKTEVAKEVPVTAAASTQLEFELSFTEPSWVSVVDGDNKEIYSKLNAAGASEKIVGKSPLKLHIGNATGTRVNYKGQLVDLGQYTKNNIARLTLSLEKN